jgi:hypothetical protein
MLPVPRLLQLLLAPQLLPSLELLLARLLPAALPVEAALQWAQSRKIKRNVFRPGRNRKNKKATVEEHRINGKDC